MRILLVASLLALVAGCTGTTTTTSTTTTGMAGMDHGGGHMMAKTVDVEIKGNKFVNQTVTVYVGDTVRWTHRDGNVPHNVVADDGSFDSHPNCAATVPVGVPVSQVCMVEGNPAYTRLFDKAGSVPYNCRVHPSMTGTVEVLAHPANMTM